MTREQAQKNARKTRTWHAQYAALTAQIEALEEQRDTLEQDLCPECHELRHEHCFGCEFADYFDEPRQRQTAADRRFEQTMTAVAARVADGTLKRAV